MFDVPLTDTPANITVIRFTPAGIDVKSMLVPEVEATAVPELITPVVVKFEPSRTILMLRPPMHEVQQL
jgi:hypothetical protein